MRLKDLSAKEHADLLLIDLKEASSKSNRKFKSLKQKILLEIDCLDLSSEERKFYFSEINQIVSDRTEEFASEKLKNVNTRFFKSHPALAKVCCGVGLCTVLEIGNFLLPSMRTFANDMKENNAFLDIQAGTIDKPISSIDEGIQNAPKQEIPQQPEQKIADPVNPLAPDLTFDPNDNTAVVDHMITFIANARECGVDFMNIDGVSKGMDFFFLANIEQLDPLDFSRLRYYTKTTDMMINSWNWCTNFFVDDSMTVTSDKQLNYDLIFSHQPSAQLVMDFQSLIAKYNDAEKSEKKEIAKELETFVEERLKNDDTDKYNAGALMLCGVLAKSVDVILPKGLSDNLMNFVGQDLYTCDKTAPYGTNQKSQRAQKETEMREIIKDKLLLANSMDYRNQDSSLVSAFECLTGIELEQLILEGVEALNPEFVENKKFQYTVGTSGTYKKTTTAKDSESTVTLENGKIISNEEIQNAGLNPETVTQEQYEKAVIEQFEQEAKEDFDKNANTKKWDAQSAFYDGYNGVDPKSQEQLYLENYRKGVEAKALLNSNSVPKTETIKVPEQVVESTEQNTEQDFVEPPVKESESKTETHECQFVLIESQEPSCLSEGFKIYACTCGKINQEVIPALGHNEGEAVLTFSPDGKQEILTTSCLRCGDVLSIVTTNIVENDFVEDGFVEYDFVEESDSYVNLEDTKDQNASVSELTKLKAFRNMLATAILNPTYNMDTGMFALGNEEYVANQKTKSA